MILYKFHGFKCMGLLFVGCAKTLLKQLVCVIIFHLCKQLKEKSKMRNYWTGILFYLYFHCVECKNITPIPTTLWAGHSFDDFLFADHSINVMLRLVTKSKNYLTQIIKHLIAYQLFPFAWKNLTDTCKRVVCFHQHLSHDSGHSCSGISKFPLSCYLGCMSTEQN